MSLRLLTAASEHAGPVIDVGAGQSRLADALLAAGWSDVTVLDVSAQALAAVTQRLGQHQAALTVVVADLLTWRRPAPIRPGMTGRSSTSSSIPATAPATWAPLPALSPQAAYWSSVSSPAHVHRLI